MIPLTDLYDEYIDRPKLTELKKPSWVCSSSLPTKVGVGAITDAFIFERKFSFSVEPYLMYFTKEPSSFILDCIFSTS